MSIELTKEMKEIIKSAVGIEGLSFKYSPAFDVSVKGNEPASHRAMCRGEKTRFKWVWVGGANGPYDFDSAAQAKLFVLEMQAEALRRSEA